jgi:hypothetical protein
LRIIVARYNGFVDAEITLAIGVDRGQAISGFLIRRFSRSI